jgi:hypothetical protein
MECGGLPLSAMLNFPAMAQESAITGSGKPPEKREQAPALQKGQFPAIL